MNRLERCSCNDINCSLVAQVQAALIGESDAARVAQVFKALSDPNRIRLIAALVQSELCVYDLAAVLEMSHSAVSHQLKLLRELELVQYRKEGRHVYYQLADQHVENLFQQTLDHIQHE